MIGVSAVAGSARSSARRLDAGDLRELDVHEDQIRTLLSGAIATPASPSGASISR